MPVLLTGSHREIRKSLNEGGKKRKEKLNRATGYPLPLLIRRNTEFGVPNSQKQDFRCGALCVPSAT